MLRFSYVALASRLSRPRFRSRFSVIPPWTIRERPQIDLECPRGSMLLREVNVSFRDVRGKHESVMFVAPRISQLLELFRPEHFSQGIRRIHCAVDQDMNDVNPF